MWQKANADAFSGKKLGKKPYHQCFSLSVFNFITTHQLNAHIIREVRLSVADVPPACSRQINRRLSGADTHCRI